MSQELSDGSHDPRPRAHPRYDEVISAGRFRYIKRTEGVSTTVLVGRLLSMTKEHLSSPERAAGTGEEADLGTPAIPPPAAMLLPTSTRFAQFLSSAERDVSARARALAEAKNVVYIDGAWDLLHSGHVMALQKAAALGDFLLVGVHDDATVNEHKGLNYPACGLHERALCVLSCKYVDDVVIGAPWAGTDDLIKTFNIRTIVSGALNPEKLEADGGDAEAYVTARERGMFKSVRSGSTLTTEELVARIIANRARFVERNTSKEAAEREYMKRKTYVKEV